MYANVLPGLIPAHQEFAKLLRVAAKQPSGFRTFHEL